MLPKKKKKKKILVPYDAVPAAQYIDSAGLASKAKKGTRIIKVSNNLYIAEWFLKIPLAKKYTDTEIKDKVIKGESHAKSSTL